MSVFPDQLFSSRMLILLDLGVDTRDLETKVHPKVCNHGGLLLVESAY